MRICILGVGVTGHAVARHAHAAGNEVLVYAGNDTDANRQRGAELEKCGIEVIYSENVQGNFDLCVPSPGISENSEFYLAGKACSKEIISEPEYAWRLSPKNWIAITGTNGKTTTAALTAHILRFCGKGVKLCGNTQDMTVSEAVSTREPDDIIVAELSSFQLASTARFAPDVAILLNISPDHIIWHKTFEAYCKAKANIFAHMGKSGCAVVGKDALEYIEKDVLSRSSAQVFVVDQSGKSGKSGAQSSEACEGGAQGSVAGEGETRAFIDANGILCISADDKKIELCKQQSMSLQGEHNMQNALCAAVASYKMGCEPKSIAQALRNFSALPHRIEFCGTCSIEAGQDDACLSEANKNTRFTEACNTVSFYDDSKATNVDATIKALQAFDKQKVILLAGGRDKESSLDKLVLAAKSCCYAVVCYGEAGARFSDAFESAGVRSEKCKNLSAAFECACKFAAKAFMSSGASKEGAATNDTATKTNSAATNNECAVLLSPACASFDEFSGFEQRGDAFKKMVSDFISSNHILQEMR